MIRAAQSFDVPFDGEPWVITVKKSKKNRSLDQNRLYWMHLNVISAENGDSPQYLHEWYKSKFLAEEKIEGSAGDITIEPSTTKLTTKQMSAYMEQIRMHAREFFGLSLPLPGDDGYDQMVEMAP